MADNDSETDIEFASVEDFIAAPLPTEPIPTKVQSREALVKLALLHAILPPMRRRLKSGKLRAMIIKVPDPSWVGPIERGLHDLAHEHAHFVAKSSPPGRDRSVPDLARQLSLGRQVIGVSSAPDAWLPEVLLTAAQVRIEIPPLDASMARMLMRMCQNGHMPREVETLQPQLLTFDEITSIVVPGARIAETIERLTAVIEMRAKVGTRRDRLPRLEDAHEYGEARRWALDLRDDLADVRRGIIGIDQVDKGCVLHGPPGTGKTLLARMIGQELGIPTVISSVPGWFTAGGGYLPDVIKAQRAAFEEALAKAPAILLLDEINALPNIDHLGNSRNKDYWAPVILDFYQLLDGAMQGRDGLIVIGTTNRVEDLNPAILRPARLERTFHIGAPDATGVENIMRHHLAGELVDDDLTMLAQINAGYRRTGAELMEQVRAAKRSARRAGRAITIDDLRSRIVGQEVRSKADLRRTAVHEAGHVIAARQVNTAQVQFVTIAGNGAAGGATKFDVVDSNFRTKADYERIVISLLGGRAAEQVVLGEPSQGAGGHPDSDLAKATKLMALMHARTGLGDTLAYLGGSAQVEGLLTSDRLLRDKVEASLRDLYRRTLALITASKGEVTMLADALVEREFLSGKDVESLIGWSESSGASRTKRGFPAAQ